MTAPKRIGAIALAIAEWSGVIVFSVILIVVAAVGIVLAWVGDPPTPLGHGQPSGADPEPAVAAVSSPHTVPPASAEESASLFAPVYSVLVSPRCMNCHPAGDRPLSDRSGAHAMNISRQSFEAGLLCSTCHSEHNTELPGSPPGPPGAPHWQLPPKDVPMVFQDRTVTALCKQLRDPAHNGERTLDDLLEHVSKDPLVLWGWSPGGNRATPPLSHGDFVASFGAWVDAGGICPGEDVAPSLTGESEELAEPEAPVAG
ncbi:MAG: hypothetical protein AB1Z98_17670 [Nannocystaceae bacterium]